MYDIKHFNKTTGIITFVRKTDSKEIDINCLEYNDYRRVSENHYIDLNNGDIVNNLLPTRVFMGDIDNMLKRATQYEYDEWHTRVDIYKETDNALVHNLIMNA